MYVSNTRVFLSTDSERVNWYDDSVQLSKPVPYYPVPDTSLSRAPPVRSGGERRLPQEKT